jgi:hypothetical protein
MSIAVYKVSGPYTASVYYGYSTSEDIRTSFMTGTQRTDAEDSNRGDFRMLQSNKGNDASLVFEVIGEFGDEFDAWCMRNDYRATDPRAITGPTMFPTTAFTRAKKEAPARVEKWSRARQYDTALEAYQGGVFTFAQIKGLCQKMGDTIVKTALAALTPAEFAAQYGL